MSAVPVVYETPSRRQSFRVSTPAEVTVNGRRYPTRDWSTGGFSIDRFDEAAAPDDLLAVTFALDFQGFAISFCCQARVVRRQGGLLAAEFVGLGEREECLLRYFNSSLVSGQMAPVDGVLKSLDRPVTRIATGPPSAAAPARGVVRRITAACLYLVLGIGILGLASLTILTHVTQVNVDTAVTSVPLEQVVSADVGTIAELNVKPGMQVSAGQALLRVDSEIAVRNVQQARQDLDAARIALQQLTARRQDEEKRLEDYKRISNDQLAARKAQTLSAIAARDVVQTELKRYQSLLESEIISKQAYDTVKAKYDELAANVEHARAEEKIAATSIESTNAHGYFFSGNYLVGDLNATIAAESAARAQVQASQEALDVMLKQESKRLYRAPFAATVLKVFKSRGMTVDRGEALIVLRETGLDPYIDAYLTQDEAGQLATGARGTATISAAGQRYQVEVVAVDRTAGFLKDIQTPKLQQPLFQWRNIEDRSAYARLAFVGLSPADRETISAGLPVFVSVPRKRSLLPDWLKTVHAATAATAATPRLWPADSPLFTGARVTDPGFEGVRRRVVEAADAALRSAPAPVETVRSAGRTDRSSPDFQASRRAFQDADHCALMALAYRLTGKKEYGEGARRVLEAWARSNRPTGMPIDETRLDGFLWGLDLLGPQSTEVTAWLERWLAADRAYRFGPVTATNNHKTHHLKIMLMLDRLVGRDADYASDLAAVEQQRKANLPTPDGKSIDYEQRDAMHYHVFNLEAWLEIALVSGCCGDSIDRSFHFFERTLAEDPRHLEFARTTAAIDKRRAAAGFEYAQARAFDVRQAARMVFTYATLPGRQVDRETWKAAAEGDTQSNLLYEARYYLWNAHR